MSDNATPEPTPRLTRQEELQLLLADMTDPGPMNSVFGSAQQARLREATGFDLRDEPPVRPGEGPS